MVRSTAAKGSVIGIGMLLSITSRDPFKNFEHKIVGSRQKHDVESQMDV